VVKLIQLADLKTGNHTDTGNSNFYAMRWNWSIRQAIFTREGRPMGAAARHRRVSILVQFSRRVSTNEDRFFSVALENGTVMYGAAAASQPLW